MRFITLFLLIGIGVFFSILSVNYFKYQTEVYISHIHYKVIQHFQWKDISHSDKKATKAFYTWENKADVSNTTLESIEFYPWNDEYDYNKICVTLVNRIKSFSGPLLIHNGFPGGLGHKTRHIIQSLIHSLSARRPVRFLMLDSFWLGTNSCLKPLQITWGEAIKISRDLDKPIIACTVPACRQHQGSSPVILYNYYSEFRIRSMKNIPSLGLGVKFPSSRSFKSVLHRLVLNPPKDTQELVLEQLKSFPKSYTTVHIRSGGKLANHKEVGYWMTKKDVPRVSTFVKNTIRANHFPDTVFLSTDSDYIERYLRKKEKMNLLQRMPVLRDHSTSNASVDALKGSLFDLFIAVQSSHLICTKWSSYSELITIMGNYRKSILLPTSFRVMDSLLR